MFQWQELSTPRNQVVFNATASQYIQKLQTNMIIGWTSWKQILHSRDDGFKALHRGVFFLTCWYRGNSCWCQLLPRVQESNDKFFLIQISSCIVMPFLLKRVFCLGYFCKRKNPSIIYFHKKRFNLLLVSFIFDKLSTFTFSGDSVSACAQSSRVWPIWWWKCMPLMEMKMS